MGQRSLTGTKKSENYHAYVTYSSQYSLMPLLKPLRFNSLSQLWALSLFKISILFHISCPCLLGRAGAAARAQSAVLVLEMVSLSRELVHEMSRIKKKNHILFCLCFKTGWVIDSKPYIIVPSRQMARSWFALQSQFSAASHNPTHLHNLPIKKGLGCFYMCFTRHTSKLRD